MRKYRPVYWILAAALALLLAAGCARRDDPTGSQPPTNRPGSTSRFTLDYGPTGYDLLPRNGNGLTLTESPLRTSQTYLPPGYAPQGSGRPFPVLYLLLDFGGNGSTPDVTDDYYFEIGLKLIADSLINGGVIKPMLIATVDLYNAYGGSWFANNTVQGLYDDCLSTFVDFTNTTRNVSVQNGRNSRGIGGVGMGGYGAIISAMRHPDLFGSASSINGHLAFSTPSQTHHFGGLKEWATHVFEENFVTPLPVLGPWSVESVTPFYSMDPNINEPLLKPWTNLVFSMAAAFSPFDTATATAFDSVTWMNAAVVGQEERNWKVTLPFDFTGELWSWTFAKWQAYDVTQILYNFPTALADIQTLVIAGKTSEFNILEQNRIFYDAAVARNAQTVTYKEFEGYTGYYTVGRNYLDRTLREVLKFHSDQFVDPWTPGP